MYLGGNHRWVPPFGGASMHKDLTIQNHVYRTYSIHIAMTILNFSHTILQTNTSVINLGSPVPALSTNFRFQLDGFIF